MRKFSVLIIYLFLSACTQLKAPTPTHSDGDLIGRWESHIQQLQQLQQWTLKGRIGSRSAYRAESASILWQQQSEHFKIHLSGPLGQGSLSVQGTESHIEVQSASTGKLSSNKPQQLLDETLGWTFPLSDVKNWILGNPGKALSELDEYKLDEFGRLIFFRQNGWQANYHNYRKTGNIYLPHKVIFKHHETKLIVIIKSWRL